MCKDIVVMYSDLIYIHVVVIVVVVVVVLLQYGPVFRFQMMGSMFTYLVGSEAGGTLFNSKNEDLNAEDVYSRLTTPVFGEGVCYDCPHKVSVAWLLHARMLACT